MAENQRSLKIRTQCIIYSHFFWTAWCHKPQICSKCWPGAAMRRQRVTRVDGFLMRQVVEEARLISDVSQVPELHRVVHWGCCQQPITTGVELCMGHFGFVQLLTENLTSRQTNYNNKNVWKSMKIRKRVPLFWDGCLPFGHPNRVVRDVRRCHLSRASAGLQTRPHSSTSNYEETQRTLILLENTNGNGIQVELTRT